MSEKNQEKNYLFGNKYLAGMVIWVPALLLFTSWLWVPYLNPRPIYVPSDQEKMDRPEMVVFEYNPKAKDVEADSDMKYFGVANGQHYREFLYKDGKDPFYKTIPSAIGVSRYRRGDVRRVIIPKIYTELAWYNDVEKNVQDKKPTIELIIDNASSDDITVEIGGTKLPKIKQRSHGIIELKDREKEGDKNIFCRRNAYGRSLHDISYIH